MVVGEETYFYPTPSGGKKPYEFEWKFSDEVVMKEQNATRAFESPGKYTAEVTITDSAGLKGKQSISFEVLASARKSVASESIS